MSKVADSKLFNKFLPSLLISDEKDSVKRLRYGFFLLDFARPNQRQHFHHSRFGVLNAEQIGRSEKLNRFEYITLCLRVQKRFDFRQYMGHRVRECYGVFQELHDLILQSVRLGLWDRNA